MHSSLEPPQDGCPASEREAEPADVCVLLGPFSREHPDRWGLHLGGRVAGRVAGPGRPAGVIALGAPHFASDLLESLLREGIRAFELPARRLDPEGLALVADWLERGETDRVLLVRPPAVVRDEDVAFGLELAVTAVAHGLTYRVVAPQGGEAAVVAEGMQKAAESVRALLSVGEI